MDLETILEEEGVVLDMASGFVERLVEVNGDDPVIAADPGGTIVTSDDVSGRRRRVKKRVRVGRISKGLIGTGVVTIAAGAVHNFVISPQRTATPYKLVLCVPSGKEMDVEVQSIYHKSTNYLLGSSVPAAGLPADLTDSGLDLPAVNTNNPLQVAVKNTDAAGVDVSLVLYAATSFTKL